MVNYFETFKGVLRNKNIRGQQLFATDALCLFFAKSDGKLLPVAIQLEADNPSTIFTPHDFKYDWLLAKMYFKSTDANVHEVCYSLFKYFVFQLLIFLL